MADLRDLQELAARAQRAQAAVNALGCGPLKDSREYFAALAILDDPTVQRRVKDQLRPLLDLIKARA